jgi:hypothetical protein
VKLKAGVIDNVPFTVLNDRRRNWPLRREADRGHRNLVMPGLAVAPQSAHSRPCWQSGVRRCTPSQTVDQRKGPAPERRPDPERRARAFHRALVSTSDGAGLVRQTSIDFRALIGGVLLYLWSDRAPPFALILLSSQRQDPGTNAKTAYTNPSRSGVYGNGHDRAGG